MYTNKQVDSPLNFLSPGRDILDEVNTNIWKRAIFFISSRFITILVSHYDDGKECRSLSLFIVYSRQTTIRVRMDLPAVDYNFSGNSRSLLQEENRGPQFGTVQKYRVSGPFWVQVGVRMRVCGWIGSTRVPWSHHRNCCLARNVPDPWKIHPKSLSRGLVTCVASPTNKICKADFPDKSTNLYEVPPFFFRTTFRNSAITLASPLIPKSTTLRSSLWCCHCGVAKRQQ